MIRLIYALALTIAIECGLCFLFYRDKQTTYHTLLVNILTNPLLNILLIGIIWLANYLSINFQTTYIVSVIILELAVVFVEYYVYHYIGHPKRKAIILATTLNIISFAIGTLIFPIAI